MAPEGDPVRCAVVPVDDVLPVLDRAIQLLEELSQWTAPQAPTTGRAMPGNVV
jgi:hypothetical protein